MALGAPTLEDPSARRSVNLLVFFKENVQVADERQECNQQRPCHADEEHNFQDQN